jgi:hypothetical protein
MIIDIVCDIIAYFLDLWKAYKMINVAQQKLPY